MKQIDAVLIAGPTASGKSKLALELALAHDGVVINADSIQVYAGLRILTARPSPDEMQGISHRLYGHADPTQPYSTGIWLRQAADELESVLTSGKLPIFVGGTGLYFRALTQGLDDMPEIPAELRQDLRDQMAERGPAALHQELLLLDAVAAQRIKASDSQRILRALELIRTSGKALDTLQAGAGRALLSGRHLRKIVLVPERAVLRQRIAVRFERMMQEGAMQEALDFAAVPGAMDHSAALAIGVREMLAHARGETRLEQAVQLAITRTRQYAKRQETWFRNQFDESWERMVT
ncbi:tRNA (adenosine(37)-N6)-dimethylallyltransferase MiaA [Aureimonas fodinaquatilis]|uniref:tRNA dimethylallyltransferase n=1 Tax=Aureimonas fodinaquatilis TaxID=2565783 RepID=A0A5B0DZM6_9HYPH|nr:tRNA (adenosine(37)-N6)-dimethylallyltransferase MiaA [Aureimonas fodinaquatilis]KAA0972244.1 tRNA (adenosine(37)-N6)-dimethylallyltransferase MiaA [Aureimonas fodinaquatilis]